jgi:hypothetical protein
MFPDRNETEEMGRSGEKDHERQDAEGRKGPGQDFTQIPNAHAAGLGAMGRNDEKLPSMEDDDEEMENDGPVY